MRLARIWRVGALVVLFAVIAVIAVAASGGDDASRTSPAVAAVPAPTGFADVVARATPSVVQIRSARGLGARASSFDCDGHVVTNAHVVAGATRFDVTDATGPTHKATLRGDVPGGRPRGHRRRAAATCRRPSSPTPRRSASGDYALAIGNPLGLRSSVTLRASSSSTSRTVSEGGGVALPSVIQTSAPINPGNSGGALVDANGAVIGVPTLAALDPEMGGSAAGGIGFAISSNTVRSIAPQLIDHGRVVASGRAFLGLDLRTPPGGAPVAVAVTANGPAADAGIRPGDQLLRIGGTPVRSVDDIAVALAERKPGQTVPVEVRRGGQGTRTVQVKLGETPVAR